MPGPCFLTGRHVGGIEEVFEIFPPLIHNILWRGQQHTIPTVHSVNSTLLPHPQTPDGGPEPFRSRPGVILHCLTKLLPCPGLCLSDRRSRSLVSCLRSPTGQKGMVGLLLQPDSIPGVR